MVYEYQVSLFYDLHKETYESIEFYCPDAIIKKLLIDIFSFSTYCIEQYLTPCAYKEIVPFGVSKKRIVYTIRFDHLSIEVFQKCIFEFIASLPNREGDQKKPSVELLQLGSILGNTTSERLIDQLLTYYKENNHD